MPRSRASSMDRTVAPCSRATRSAVSAVRSGSMSARIPSSSGRGDASRTSRSPSWIGFLARISRRSRCSRLAKDSFGYGSGLPGPAQAARLPYRSSIATGMPVSSCSALAIPGWPSPETATRVSRSWMSMPRCRLVTVWASAAFVAASSAAVARSRACSRAFDTATPVCWAMTWMRNRCSADGSRWLDATRCPSRPLTLRSGYAQAQRRLGKSTLPPSSPSAASCLADVADAGARDGRSGGRHSPSLKP